MKLFSKIATAFVGIAMAVGVGVAVNSQTSIKEARADTANFTLSSASDVTVDGVTASFAKGSGSNAPAWYAAGLRLYASNTVTISSSSSITGISFNWEKQGSKAFATVTASVGSYTHPSAAGVGTWSGSANSVVFTLGSSGQLQLNTFSVTHGGGTTTYTVSYDANEHGTGTMTDSTEYESGDTVTVLANTFVADTDYEFVNFNTAADGSGTSYDGGDTFTISDNVTLYAQWNYTGVGPDYSIEASTTSQLSTDPWSTTANPNAVETTNLSRGWQWSGGNSAVLTYSTTESIKRVVVYASTNGDSSSVAVSVGGSAFGGDAQSIASGTASAKSPYTFEDDAVSGNVVITLTNTASKSVYINKIEIYYGEDLPELDILDYQDVELPHTMYVGTTSRVFKAIDKDTRETVSGDLTWTVGDDTVLSIVSTAQYYSRISALKVGSTTLTVSKTGYKSATGTVNVIEDPTKPEMEVWDTSGKVSENATYYYSSTVDIYKFTARNVEDTSVTVDDAVWESSDTTVATVTSSAGQCSLTTLKPGELDLTATSSSYQSVTVHIEIIKGSLEELNYDGNPSKTVYNDNEDWSADGVTISATYHSGWVEDVTSQVEWSFNPAKPAEGVDSVTFTASFDGESVTTPAWAVTVTHQHAGTAEDPFTVAEGIAKCKEIGTTAAGPWVVKGIISKVTTWDSRYPNITYWISDDGEGTSTANSIQCFRGKYLEGANVTADNCGEFAVGKIATITGNLVNYNSNTPEYAANNYPLSLEAAPTGDIDITFEPTTSYEIGATGTFTATSTTEGVTFTYSVDDSSVLSVDASTGAFEALGLGVAHVTVTGTKGDLEGSAVASIIVNGAIDEPISVQEANDIAAAVPSGTTTDYYIYVEGYVKEFATSMSSDSKPRALDIMNYDETVKIMVYTNTGGYNDFVNGLNLGDLVKVKACVQNYNGTYELTIPEKISASYSDVSFAFEFLSATDAVCENYDGIADKKEELEAIWPGLKTSFQSLDSDVQDDIANTEASESGTHLQQAMARYDYVVGKYELDNFISGRTPVVFANQPIQTSNNMVNTNVAMISVVIVAVVSLSAIGVLLVVKRRKSVR